MAGNDDIEDRLAKLAALRRESDAAKVRKHLQAALEQRRSGLLVAKAAELAGELEIDALAPQMEAAFQRLLVQPVKRDKGCQAKTALAKALVELELPASQVFLAGIRCTQPEPVWGGSVDTAAQLRGWCAHGLVRMRHADAILEVTTLLVDPERPARLAAVDALGDSGQAAAEALLRLKALTGDAEAEVVGECMKSLLRLEPHRSLAFVGGYLGADPSLAEGAAIALGESRLEGAVDLLVEHLERTVDRELLRYLYLALALSRHDRALEVLITEVAEGPADKARLALLALALHRHNQSLHQRLEPLVSERCHKDLTEIWRREFEP